MHDCIVAHPEHFSSDDDDSDSESEGGESDSESDAESDGGKSVRLTALTLLPPTATHTYVLPRSDGRRVPQCSGCWRTCTPPVLMVGVYDFSPPLL
jgi:hypothetical protein